jgi:transcriptional regulator with XRE-family HTH domain
LSEVNARFSEILDSLKKNGIKQFDVAEKLGVTETAVSAWKSDRRNISDSLMVSICREFNVRMDFLKNGNGEMFEEYLEEDETAALVQNLLDKNSPFYDSILSIMRMYDKLNGNSQKVVDDFLKSIVDDLQNKKED